MKAAKRHDSTAYGLGPKFGGFVSVFRGACLGGVGAGAVAAAGLGLGGLWAWVWG